ncbi:YjbF family lipoprotein [Roseibacterium beibuensis]|uniref:Group 4 capsule polysaccharide lipoprotein gfcB, YjbF n=1 Tax=[Roseibacterium] beibuensis TaxID=1193142 RepID=A0ABP9KWF8_9RHOB|nr:YjbF family lipoprotein [Roseibacterium beibuensis]MCS6621902.1 YjbF family lipoprotein [Roseibacterium beibuensis]
MALISLPRPLVACAAAACLVLSACGTAEESPLGTVLGGVASGFGPFGGGSDAAPSDPRQALDRATIEAIGQPLLTAELTALPGASLMTRVGRNRGVDSWRDSAGLGLALSYAGLLRATRGFGFDLMSSDASGTAHALAARRPAEVNRTMVYLDGELREAREIHRCRLTVEGQAGIEIVGRSHATTRISEACSRPDGDSYTNRYWVEASGTIRRSEQWISDEVGSIRLDRLTD